MNELYVHHHLGLGDHIDCNAMVRIFLKEYGLDKVNVFAKERYTSMIKHMYRDEPKIAIISVPNNPEDEYSTISKLIQLHDLSPEVNVRVQSRDNNKSFLRVGHEHYPWGREKELGLACAEIFYKQVNIDFSRRFSDYFCQRDKEEEMRLFNKLNPTREKYVFVHDDPPLGFKVSPEKLFKTYGEEIKIIENDITENIFHFTKILLEAEQIHLMESSFKSIVETLGVEKECYFHNFRPDASSLLGKTLQDWREIKYDSP